MLWCQRTQFAANRPERQMSLVLAAETKMSEALVVLK